MNHVQPAGEPALLNTIRDASSAHIHDWLFGGVDNYQADREAGAALQEAVPQVWRLVRDSRIFLWKAVRSLATDGSDQFLDLGCGLPAWDWGLVHEAAQGVRPEAKVVYVDNDPIVLAHARTGLEDNENIKVVDSDLRDTRTIQKATRTFLDWNRPIVALFSMVLDCLPDDGTDPADVVRATARALPPGSTLVLTQLVSDDPAIREAVTDIMTAATGARWGRMRDPGFIHQCVQGLETIPPGPGNIAPRSHTGPLDGTAVWSALAGVPTSH